MELTERQKEISRIVKEEGPITGQVIAKRLHVTRAALRSDLAILTMTGILDARPRVGYYYMGQSHMNPVADALEGYEVRDYMSQPVVVDRTTSIYDATITMFLEDVGTLLVGDGEYLVGVISRKDVLRSILGTGSEKEVPVTMSMTPVNKIIYAEPEEQMLTVAQRMMDYGVDCLPIIEKVEMEEGKKVRLKIIGRVSKTNITQLFVECGRRYPAQEKV